MVNCGSPHSEQVRRKGQPQRFGDVMCARLDTRQLQRE
jgi:hypothetical protein